MAESGQSPVGKRQEFWAFFALAVALGPAVSVAFVGGLGLVIWLFQLVVGPPGPPGG